MRLWKHLKTNKGFYLGLLGLVGLMLASQAMAGDDALSKIFDTPVQEVKGHQSNISSFAYMTEGALGLFTAVAKRSVGVLLFGLPVVIIFTNLMFSLI